MSHSIARKTAGVFAALALLIIATGVMGHRGVSIVSDHALEIGSELAPLVDASMEIKLTATEAHLLFEEIMAGDDTESIADVWALLDDARFFATAILEGGTNAEGTFVAATSPAVRAHVGEVLENLDVFVAAAEQRHATRASDQGVGSDADARFDALYDDIVARLAAADRPAGPQAIAVERAIGEARYALAHGHLLVAEILGGDTGEDIAEALGSFAAARDAASALPPAQARPIQSDIDALIASARERYGAAAAVEGAGSGADEAFDRTYEALIAAADAAETLIQEEIAASIAALRAETIAARTQALAVAGLAIVAAIVAWALFGARLARRIADVAATTRALASGDLSAKLPQWDSRDELGILREATSGFRAALTERAALDNRLKEDEARRAQEKASLLADLAARFRKETDAVLAALAQAAEGMNGAVSTLGSAGSQVATATHGANRSAETAAGDIGTVASAAQQLTASIVEIGEQVSRAAREITGATTEARASDERIGSLADAAGRIGDIVGLIRSIAEQTNLLALNATIEAARAGEAGKGFAVVAAEVKALADQTGKATEEIAVQIAAIQGSTGEAVRAIRSVANRMSEVDRLAGGIAAAVEEQGSATAEIGRTVVSAADGAQAVMASARKAAEAAESASGATHAVQDAARTVRREIETLGRAIDGFVARLEAA